MWLQTKYSESRFTNIDTFSSKSELRCRKSIWPNSANAFLKSKFRTTLICNRRLTRVNTGSLPHKSPADNCEPQASRTWPAVYLRKPFPPHAHEPPSNNKYLVWFCNNLLWKIPFGRKIFSKAKLSSSQAVRAPSAECKPRQWFFLEPMLP